MTLDLATTAFVSQLAVNAAKPLHEMTPEEARLALGPLAQFYGDGPEMAEERDHAATIRDGATINLRVLKPKGTPRSVIVYYHGGGWVLGNIDDYRSHGRRLAERAALTALICRIPISTGWRKTWPPMAWVNASTGAIARTSLSGLESRRVSTISYSSIRHRSQTPSVPTIALMCSATIPRCYERPFACLHPRARSTFRTINENSSSTRNLVATSFLRSFPAGFSTQISALANVLRIAAGACSTA